MSSNTVVADAETMSSNTVIASAETLSEKQGVLNPRLRQRPRIADRRPLLAIPVRPDGSPDWKNRFAGHTTDIGLEGLGLELPQDLNLQTLGLVLSLAGGEGQAPGYLGVEIGGTENAGRDIRHAGGQFTGFAHELLGSENLTPRLNARRWQFEMPYLEAILDQWVQIGVLEPVLWDRVQLCPRCRALPTFRRGCNACGSIHVNNDRLMHHFACAHVGLVTEFEDKGQLICPKCRGRQLVVGADYEYMTGPYRCQDCQWADDELEQVAQCLGCQLRFPAHQAYEQELKGYRAHRLDPLALLPALGPTPAVLAGAALDRRPALCAH